MADIFRVREGITFEMPRGTPVVLRRGELFPADHPYLKGREVYFEAVENAAVRTPGAAVEIATAAPGERRSIQPVRTVPVPDAPSPSGATKVEPTTPGTSTPRVSSAPKVKAKE